MAVLQAFLLLLVATTFWVTTVLADVAATETLIGIVGRDFILLGADSSISGGSIAFTSTNLDKIAVLVDPFPSQSFDSERSVNTDSDSRNSHSRNKNGWVQNQAFLSRSIHSQQPIAAAVAGDAADADRLVSLLHAYGAMQEYENGVGCDVEFYNHNATSNEYVPITTNSGSQMAGLSVMQMAHLARRFIYDQLRSRTPFQVGMLIAGMMAESGESSDEAVVDDIDEEQHVSLSARVRQQVQVATSFAIKKGTEEASAGETNVAGLVEETQSPLGLSPHLYWLDQYGAFQRMKEFAVHGYAGSLCLSILDKSYRADMTLAEGHDLMQKCFRELRQRYLINQAAAPPCIKCIDANGCRLLS